MSWRNRWPALPWVAPFALFMAVLAVAPALGLAQPWDALLRVGVPLLALLLLSWPVLRTLRVQHPVADVALGVGVCALWVAPDFLVPGWRAHPLFQNALTGTLTVTVPPAELADPLVLTLRVARAALLVPVVEELFWRGWLPRWLANPSWQGVALGHYTWLGFLGTAVLFAAEHGPFWEVGLLCGLLYNAWMWRTRSPGDLILVHAVTNAALGAVVLGTGRYEFWM